MDFSTIPQEIKTTLITLLALSDGVYSKMVLPIGLEETLGDHTGVKKDSSRLLEELIIWVLKVFAIGLFQLIPGLMILEILLHQQLQSQNHLKLS